MDYTTFMGLRRNPEEMQRIFKDHHIVVRNWPCPPTEFDEEAMEAITSPSKPITIHGMFHQQLLLAAILMKPDLSILPQSHDGDERHTIGVTGDLLKSHRSPSGKILNALDFPMPTRGDYRPLESLATDILAFNQTLDDPHCKRTKEFPAADWYWALVALLHAFHYVHIDADGLATFIAPQTGLKFWMVGRSKPGKSFSATDIYVGGKYAIDQINEEIYDTEGVLLRVGDVM